MKFRNLLLLAMLATLIALPGCKKGPEDPGLTLKSRMARLTGDWELSELTLNGKDQLVTIEVDSFSAGSCGTEIITTTFTTQNEMTFEKNGDYTSVTTSTLTIKTVYTEPDPGFCDNETTTNSNVNKVDGMWNFAGGAGDTKNKEYLVITDLDGEPQSYIHLLRLSSKELIYEIIEETPNKRDVYRFVFTKKS